MKVFTGTDIIEISRIKNSIENLGDSFINKIFTENEILYCNKKNNAKYQHYAARFAAKEAIFKAISPILNSKFELSWKNVEIVNLNDGKPIINFIDTNIQDKMESIDISLSHSKEFAIASVVMVLKESKF